MQAIARILHYSLPKPPADLIFGPSLQAIWERCRPEELATLEPLFYCGRRLFVMVPGSAAAARLRQEGLDLLARLRAEPGLGELREIVTRRAGRQGPPNVAVKAAAPLRSALGARCFGSLAGMVDDPALKASLARLAVALAPDGSQRA